MLKHVLLFGITLGTAFATMGNAAEETFDLSVPGTDIQSVAKRSESQLVIENGRDATTYVREPRYDARGYIGYANRELRQVLRWPESGSGNFQIGQLGFGQPAFRASRMQIKARQPTRPLSDPADKPINSSDKNDGKIDTEAIYAIESGLERDTFLSAEPFRDSIVGISSGKQSRNIRFQFVAAGNDYYHIVSVENPEMAVEDDGQGKVRLSPTSDGFHRTMRFRPTHATEDYVYIETATGGEYVLDVEESRGGGPSTVRIFRKDKVENQLFRLVKVGTTAPTKPTRSLVSREVVPNPPLKPVTV